MLPGATCASTDTSGSTAALPTCLKNMLLFIRAEASAARKLAYARVVRPAASAAERRTASGACPAFALAATPGHGASTSQFRPTQKRKGKAGLLCLLCALCGAVLYSRAAFADDDHRHKGHQNRVAAFVLQTGGGRQASIWPRHDSSRLSEQIQIDLDNLVACLVHRLIQIAGQHRLVFPSRLG